MEYNDQKRQVIVGNCVFRKIETVQVWLEILRTWSLQKTGIVYIHLVSAGHLPV